LLEQKKLQFLFTNRSTRDLKHVPCIGCHRNIVKVN
jgi:hypothetical protein